MNANTCTRSEPAGLLERAGVGYYRRLARHAEAGVAGRTRLDQLPPDSTLRYLSRDISGFAAMVAFFIGAAISLAIVGIDAGLAGTEDRLAFHAILIGGALLLMLVEFALLFWLGLRTVHLIACVTQQHRAEDDPFLPGDDAVSNLLARAALELPDPVVRFLGVDPMKYVSVPKLLVVGLIYKAKVILTTVAAKFLLRRLGGKLALRIGLAWVSVPIAGLWNAWVMQRVADEARFRLFGRCLANHLVDEVLDAGFIGKLTPLAREGAIRAISTMLVMTQHYHPNMLMLLVRFSETLAVEDAVAYDDWPAFLALLRQLTPEERYFLLDLLCVAAAFDGRLSRLQQRLLPNAFGASTPVYMTRIRQLIRLIRTGQIHAASELCRLDFQPG